MNETKRFSVYFNLEVPKDKMLYDYLVLSNGGKRLSTALKETALAYINGDKPIVIPESDVPCETKLSLSEDDKDNLAGMF